MSTSTSTRQHLPQNTTTQGMTSPGATSYRPMDLLTITFMTSLVPP